MRGAAKRSPLSLNMSYATATQLRNKLKVPSGTTDADLQRVLDMAMVETKSEVGNWDFTDTEDIDARLEALGNKFTSTEAQAMLTSANLARAQDLWLIEGLPIGVIGLGGETPLLSPRNSWERFANMLAPLKNEWGLA